MRKKSNFLLLILMLIIISIASPVQAKTKITLNVKKKTLVVGKTYTLKVKGTKKKAKWSSSKKAVATVSKKGKVTARKAGTAIIKAKVAGKTLKCTIIVKKKTPAKTETPKPETPKPETPPEEPVTPPVDIYNKLVDYIKTNGSAFDEQMLAISKSSPSGDNTGTSAIAYDSQNECLVFMYEVEGGVLDQFSYMYVKSSDPDETTNICHGVKKDEDLYVVLTSDFPKKSYAPEDFTYTAVNQTGVFATSDRLRESATSLFKSTNIVQYNEWNSLLKQNGFSMEELGFTLIN